MLPYFTSLQVCTSSLFLSANFRSTNSQSGGALKQVVPRTFRPFSPPCHGPCVLLSFLILFYQLYYFFVFLMTFHLYFLNLVLYVYIFSYISKSLCFPRVPPPFIFLSFSFCVRTRLLSQETCD